MSKNIHRLLIGLVVGLHMAFVVFVVLGGFLVSWRPEVAFLHLPVATYGVLIEWVGWTCPLTPVEKACRRRAGRRVPEGDFTETWILPWLPLPKSQQQSRVMIGGLVLGLNLLAYGLFLWNIR